MPAEATTQRKPLYLFADSQLLFWRRGGRLVLEPALAELAGEAPCAAYIGASNGDRSEFYDIFDEAMRAAGIAQRHRIYSSFNSKDRALLESAQVIVLAGGDVQIGWDTFLRTGMKEVILARHAQGAILVGISAGAMQLGRHAIIGETPTSFPRRLLDGFNLVPAIVDVHAEDDEWERLWGFVELSEGTVTGLGIPTGGGLVVHPDATLEALRRPVHEFRMEGIHVTHSLICPSEERY
jgi:cyanophycinase